MDETPEQEARDMLERMGVPDAQSFSSGDVVELANTIHDLATLREAVRDYLAAKDGYFGHLGNTGPATIADMNAAESRLRSLSSSPHPTDNQ